MKTQNHSQRPLWNYLATAASALMVTFGGSLLVPGISTVDTVDHPAPAPQARDAAV